MLGLLLVRLWAWAAVSIPHLYPSIHVSLPAFRVCLGACAKAAAVLSQNWNLNVKQKPQMHLALQPLNTRSFFPNNSNPGPQKWLLRDHDQTAAVGMLSTEAVPWPGNPWFVPDGSFLGTRVFLPSPGVTGNTTVDQEIKVWWAVV